MKNSLSAKQLACGFDGLALSQDINLELSSGDCLQLSGANGSGKTTLLRTLAGILPAIAGSIHWCQRSIYDAKSCYHELSVYMGHLDSLYANLSVRENMQWALRLRGYCAHKQAVERHLDYFDLGAQADSLVHELSFGQRRKVQLAALPGSEASLWLLDEPFTGLDVLTQEKLALLLNKQQESGGMVIFSSHQSVPQQLRVNQQLHLQPCLISL